MSNWKWTNFNPKVSQSDKRDRDGAISKGEKFVEKHFNELALSTFVAVPVVDHTRVILNVKMMYPPKSPLEEFWTGKENQEFVRKFVKALEDSQLWALELWELTNYYLQFFARFNNMKFTKRYYFQIIDYDIM